MNNKKVSKNLKMQKESCHRLEELARETGLTQGFITQYLIDEYYVNKYNHRDKDSNTFDFFSYS